MTANETLRTGIDLVTAREIGGYVFDPRTPDRRFVVELWLDGAPAGLARAHLFDARLMTQGCGDGACRFVFALDREADAAAELAEVRLANLDIIVGEPVRLAASRPEAPQSVAEARWSGGLQVSGRLPVGDGSPPVVRALCDGRVVAEALATQWAHAERDGAPLLARAFDLWLPPSLADGRVRRLKIVDAADRELPGSPLAIFARVDGFARSFAGRGEAEWDRLRARAFDRIFPRSLAFLDYEAWREALPEVATAPTEPMLVLLAGDGDARLSAASLAETGQGVAKIAVSAGLDAVSFGSGALTAWLEREARDSELLVFAPAGFRFHAGALARLASGFAAFPNAAIVYGDIEIEAPDGRGWPLAWPAFDYERWLEQGYGAYAFAMRTTVALAAARAGADDLFRLFQFALEGWPQRRAQEPVHVPGVLGRLPPFDPKPVAHRLAEASAAHLNARGFAASATPRLGWALPAARVRRGSTMRPRVSILVPTRDRVDLLRPCLDSIERTTAEDNVEILVADNGSAQAETRDYLEALNRRGIRIARVPGPFNFARIINAAASVASGELLLLCNNDIEAMEPGWLSEMVDRAADPTVGAVGAVLHWPSGVVQHGGVTLGSNFAVAHAFDDRREDEPGYADMLRVAHECSAVTAACLLTPRARFFELGGFDATTFAVDFNDVDYCLRLRAQGLRVVLTPHARLLHHESASRGEARRPDQVARRERELAALRLRWGDALLADPFYSPLLTLEGRPYSGLACPVRDLAPRSPRMPPPWAAPFGI